MDNIFNILKEILMPKKDNGMKIGLTQFKAPEIQPVEKKAVSIRTKDVRLSDLMRRVS